MWRAVVLILHTRQLWRQHFPVHGKPPIFFPSILKLAASFQELFDNVQVPYKLFLDLWCFLTSEKSRDIVHDISPLLRDHLGRRNSRLTSRTLVRDLIERWELIGVLGWLVVAQNNLQGKKIKKNFS